MDWNLYSQWQRHPIASLTGELWGVCCEDFGENWLRYNGTALYIVFLKIKHGECHGISGLILGLCPANERHRSKVTPSLIGWAQTENLPCIWCFGGARNQVISKHNIDRVFWEYSSFSTRGGGYKINSLCSIIFLLLQNYQNTLNLLTILFIFDGCCHSWAVVTPVKYGCDWKESGVTFSKHKKISLIGKKWQSLL